MPLLRLEVTPPVEDAKRNALLAAASRILAEVTGKPEGYAMVTLVPCAALMGGKAGPAAFVDVRGIGGLDAATNKELSKRLCELLRRELDIPPASVYLNFTDVAARNWGWKGGTFG